MSLDLVKRLGERFIERKDVKAIQHDDGTWAPIREKFALQDFLDHLEGKKTFGHYMLGSDDTVKLFAFDIDIRKFQLYGPDGKPMPDGDPDPERTTWYLTHEPGYTGPDRIYGDMREAWLTPDHDAQYDLRIQLRCMAEGLAHATHRLSGGDIHVAVSESGGKGFHVYGFTGSVEAREAREMAHLVLKSFGEAMQPTRGDNFWRHHPLGEDFQNVEIEVFPKQDSLDGKDLGNLMAMPLGINRKSGKPRRFVRLRNSYKDELETMDPFDALGGDLPWQ